MKVLGFDIGGANIKASDADGRTACVSFPMWTQHKELPEALRSLAEQICPDPDMIAATMTAELADCFDTKADGVEFVISSIENAFPNVPVRIWMTSGEFAEADDARELPTLVAAANWHALATWAGRAIPLGPAILIDVGSTTTDIIPLLDGYPVPQALNDVERLMSGELIYSGAFRTPVCAVVKSVPFRGGQCPLTAEFFATMADVLLVAGLREEDPENNETANGKPLIRKHSLNRLAHMLCCDETEISEEELQEIAEYIATEQQQQICGALHQVLNSLEKTMLQREKRSMEVEKPVAVFCGSGAAVVQRAMELLGTARFSDRMFLPEMFERPIAEAACAFAVARLAHDRCRDDLLEVQAF